MSQDLLKGAIEALGELGNRREANALVYWPTIYPTQRAAVECNLPITALFGGNQAGKSETGLRQMAWDLTGIYPDWYEGPRTINGINAWIVGESSDLTRDGLQKKLLGPDLMNPGKGGILATCYIKGRPQYRQNGGGAIDYFSVPHISGELSTCGFKNYAQGRGNLQSATLQRLLVDEEPPWDEWTELMMRVSKAIEEGVGRVTVCFTPMKGKTKVVRTLWEGNPDVGIFVLNAMEAKHLGAGHIERQTRLLRNDPAMLKARLYGLPDVSSGLIWPTVWSDHLIPRFQCDPKWPRIASIDYGWTHPTRMLSASIDPANDTIFIEKAWGGAERKYWQHANTMRPLWDLGIQFHGDPSAEQPDKSSGKKLLHSYLDELQPGWQNVPPEERAIVNAPRTPQVRIEMVQKRLDEGTLFFMDDLDPVFFSEIQDYSYDKKGRLPEVDDDYPDALGYLVQCASKARVASAYRRPWQIVIPPSETCMKGY